MKIDVTTELNVHTAPLTQARIDKLSHLIVAIPKSKGRQAWPEFAYADVLKRRLHAAQAHDEALTQLSTDLPNGAGTHVTLGLVDADINAFELLTLARKLAAAQRERHATHAAIYLPGMEPALAARVAEALLAALLAGACKLPQFKSKPDKSPALTHIDLYGFKNADFLRRTYAEAIGNNLARHLTTLPPNELTPALYRKRIAALAKQHGWRMEFLDIAALKRKKAGAFLAVAQGSPTPDAGIMHLRYQPAKPTKKPALALVGKGICFDTGGTNLKQAKHMYGMHEDMEGSAVALGTLLALTELNVDFPVDCWLALAQNHIGPNAYKQNDVVTACNGVTIEVVHTDAEGRMVLADTLALASRAKPALIIDYATLTGTCVYALGTAYSGAFTNRSELMPTIIKAGCASGERVWPFPNDSDYDTELDSPIADIKQCKMDGEADHILASRFLNRFVDKDIPWIHIDLSAGNHKGGLAHIPSDITGFGVRYTLNLLLEQNVLQNK